MIGREKEKEKKTIKNKDGGIQVAHLLNECMPQKTPQLLLGTIYHPQFGFSQLGKLSYRRIGAQIWSLDFHANFGDRTIEYE